MKAKNYPYVGDYNLDPPSITSACDHCDDLRVIALPGLNAHVECQWCKPEEPDPESDNYPD